MSGTKMSQTEMSSHRWKCSFMLQQLCHILPINRKLHHHFWRKMDFQELLHLYTRSAAISFEFSAENCANCQIRAIGIFILKRTCATRGCFFFMSWKYKTNSEKNKLRFYWELWFTSKANSMKLKWYLKKGGQCSIVVLEMLKLFMFPYFFNQKALFFVNWE